MHTSNNKCGFWPIWRRINDAWRAHSQTQDLIEGQSITEKMVEEMTREIGTG